MHVSCPVARADNNPARIVTVTMRPTGRDAHRTCECVQVPENIIREIERERVTLSLCIISPIIALARPVRVRGTVGTLQYEVKHCCITNRRRNPFVRHAVVHVRRDRSCGCLSKNNQSSACRRDGSSVTEPYPETRPMLYTMSPRASGSTHATDRRIDVKRVFRRRYCERLGQHGSVMKRIMTRLKEES